MPLATAGSGSAPLNYENFVNVYAKKKSDRQAHFKGGKRFSRAAFDRVIEACQGQVKS